MKQQVISVIIPIYNVKPYLDEAIESVLHQTYMDLEIILVDDGSTDGSGEICDGYAKRDGRIIVIHQENKGLSAARNAGLDICKGGMIAFLDPDDTFCRDMLLKMHEAMIEHDADIVECNWIIYKNIIHMNSHDTVKKMGRFWAGEDRTGLYNKQDAFRMQLDGKIAVNVWNKLYKRKMWEKLRFCEGHNYEDLDIILPLLGEAESVYILDESLVINRRRRGSITVTHTFENIRDWDMSYKNYMEYIKCHTPEFFDKKDIYTVLVIRYTSLLRLYFIYIFHSLPKKKKCISFIRQQIRETKNGIDMSCIDTSKYSEKKQVALHILINVPPFVGAIMYQVYCLSKMIMLR